MTLRAESSAARWRRLSALLIRLERGVEALARLEAHTNPNGVGRPGHAKSLEMQWSMDRRLDRLEASIVRELNRLTVARLTIDLAKKQQRADA